MAGLGEVPAGLRAVFVSARLGACAHQAEEWCVQNGAGGDLSEIAAKETFDMLVEYLKLSYPECQRLWSLMTIAQQLWAGRVGSRNVLFILDPTEKQKKPLRLTQSEPVNEEPGVMLGLNADAPKWTPETGQAGGSSSPIGRTPSTTVQASMGASRFLETLVEENEFDEVVPPVIDEEEVEENEINEVVLPVIDELPLPRIRTQDGYEDAEARQWGMMPVGMPGGAGMPGMQYAGPGMQAPMMMPGMGGPGMQVLMMPVGMPGGAGILGMQYAGPGMQAPMMMPGLAGPGMQVPMMPVGMPGGPGMPGMQYQAAREAPPPGPENPQCDWIVDIGCYRIIWKVDASKLQSNDKQAVSSEFEIDLPNHPQASFMLMIYPIIVSVKKGGGSFAMAKGAGHVELKCRAGLQEGSQANVAWRVQVRRANGGLTSAMRPAEGAVENMVRHNFATGPTSRLPKEIEVWDFRDYSDGHTFEIVVEMRVRDSMAHD